MESLHIPFESAGADSHKCNSVAVFRIHISLYLKNKSGECIIFRLDQSILTFTWGRGYGIIEKTVKQELNAKVIHSASEKDRCQSSLNYGLSAEVLSCSIQHFEILRKLKVIFLSQFILKHRILQVKDLYGCYIRSPGSPLKQMYLLCYTVIYTAKIYTIAQRIIDRECSDAEYIL